MACFVSQPAASYRVVSQPLIASGSRIAPVKTVGKRQTTWRGPMRSFAVASGAVGFLIRRRRGPATSLLARKMFGATGTGLPRSFGTSTATTTSATATLTAPTATTASSAVGDELHGWTCEQVEYLDELKCHGVRWKHLKTGAELMSVEQPLEENKTFGVVFRTPPEDSNGIAHVLEHSVLCGSRKYPVKDPFAELLKGSVQTFLNAMTFPDRTCYPVASCNLQDFYNLVDVYLDAVFHPRAISDPLVLAQEGWHYELEDKSQPLSFKGVVFNEMKGVYSNPDTLQSRALLNNLLPDTPYSVDSGGDPKEIPNLTFDYFKGFHDRFYHPSNAKFWFYGDDNPTKRLQILDEYLRDFERKAVTSAIPTQPLWKEPRKIEHDFAVGADEDISKKAMACASWLLTDSKADLQTSMALSILDYVIMGTPGAPLRKALTDSGLGSRVIGGGLYDGLVQPCFSVGLKDIRLEDVSKVEEIIMTTLKRLVDEGLDKQAIEAALNRIEFMNRELNTGGTPRGLALMFAAISNWNYGEDPFEALRYEGPLNALREKLVELKEPLLEELIRDKLLANPHRLFVTSKPSYEEGPRRDEEEKERLTKQKELLSSSDLDSLIAETATLKKLQETPDPPESLALVPRLSLSDLPKEITKIPTELSNLGSATVLRHPLLTSGVVYVDVAFDLSGVPTELLTLLPLFCRGLREMGTSKSDYVQFQLRSDLSTGGISASPLVSAKRNSDDAVAYLVLRGKAMESKTTSLLDLMAEMCTEVNWSNQARFIQLVREAQAGARSALLSSGHSIAATRLGSHSTSAGWASEQMSGLTQFEFLGRVLTDAEKNWSSVEAKLRSLQSAIFGQQCIVNLTADSSILSKLDPEIDRFLSHLPASVTSGGKWSPLFAPISEGILIPSQVNYVAKSANLYRDGNYKLHGSSIVASRLLGTTYLWDRVRIIGGAYGGFCRFDVRSGDFKYISYRDPNLKQTIETYDATPEYLRKLELTEDDLVKGIIGTIGDVDSYQLPDAKGYTAMMRHMLGETDEQRQERRNEILSTTAAEIRGFAEALETVSRSGHVCVVGNEAAVRAAADDLGLKLRSPLASVEATAPPAA